MAVKPKPTVVTDDFLSRLGAIEASLKIFVDEFKLEREDAKKHRAALRETIAALSESVRILNREVDEHGPLIDDYRQTRDQARGAVKFGRWLYGGLILLAGAIGALINQLAGLFKGHP